MKLESLSIIILTLFFSCLSYSDPLIVVAIMVKNEEAVIKPTLEPYLKADPKGEKINYLVFDTGLDSWSLTMQKAQELFNEYGTNNYYIIQEPFIDFATSRNRALDLVEEKFPHACFVLMPDAEWYINNVEALIKYCEHERYHEGFGPYFIRIIESKLDFFTPRLLRQNLHSRFKGVVHEALSVHAHQIGCTKLPDDIYFRYSPSIDGQKKTMQRYIRDRDLLLKQYQQDSSDAHATFYLAQTYEFLGDWANAYYYYTIRTTQPGSDEDNFLAAYRRAVAADNLESSQKVFSWLEVQELYLQAYKMRPFRIEPLIRIAQHYLKEQNMALAFLYARCTLDIGYPYDDINFIEKDMYYFERYQLMGVCCWYLAHYELGQWAMRKAIEARPDIQLLYQNLEYYINRGN